MTRVALLGASGFVGSEIARALEQRGVGVVRIAAPRLHTAARTEKALAREASDLAATHVGTSLAQALVGCRAVINAAGVAAATGGGDDLFGANALLPALLALTVPGDARLVHVSSAAVQGRREVLDESAAHASFSPYSESKALGERLVLALAPSGVNYRPTSVQGPERDVTAMLRRVCRAPLASVARPGTDPSPQVLVANVADAAAFLALVEEDVPPIVLHPWEGLTTRDVVLLLGRRKPALLPRRVARACLSLAGALGRSSGRVAGLVRRVEMLWFGQRQTGSWLDGRWSPPVGRAGWEELS